MQRGAHPFRNATTASEGKGAMSMLFRKEAVDHQRHRLFGEVRLDAPLPMWALAGVLAAVAGGALLVLILGTYARRETVSGWLTPDKGLVRLSVEEPGTVREIFVREGEDVPAGAALFSVSRDVGLEGGGSANARVMEHIRAERDQVARRLGLLAEQFRTSREKLSARLAGLAAGRQQHLRQLEFQEKRAALADRMVEQIDALVQRGVISLLERQRREENALAQRQALEGLLGQIAETDRGLAEGEGEMRGLPAGEQAAEAELKERLAALDQRLAEASGRGTVVVRAPVAGQLAAVTVRPGQRVKPDAMTVSVLPEGGVLQAELYVPSRAAGFVKAGQAVRLRYDAFPYQKFGAAEAGVAAVSRTILSPEDLPLASSIKEPVFRVFVDLRSDTVNAYGEAIRLQAGMTLTADIVLERRRLWEVLLDPVLAAARH